MMRKPDGTWYIKRGGQWVPLFTPSYFDAHDEIEYQALKTQGTHFACSAYWCSKGLR